MIAITVFDGLYCNASPVIEKIAQTTGYQVVTDKEVVAEASRLSGLPEDRLASVLPPHSGAACCTPDHGEATGWLRLALATMLSERRDRIFHGFAPFLLPPKLKHVLRVCLVSTMRERMAEGARVSQCSDQELRDAIFADDAARAEWVMAYTESNDPWDRRLYDLVLPVASLGIRQSACRAVEQLCNAALQHPDSSRESLDEFLLAAKGQAALSHWGGCVSVAAKGRSLTLGFCDKKGVSGAMARELRDLASGIDGVKDVYVGFGGSYSEADVLDRRERRVSTIRRSGALGVDRSPAPIHEPSGRGDRDRAVAARVRDALSREGYPVSVDVEDGSVSLAVMSHAEMLQAVARKLCDTVSALDGVECVDAGIAGLYHKTAAYDRLRRGAAFRLLREDDREFPPFLAERLRDSGKVSISLYDGETVLNADHERKPAVVLLDADLPGFDGAEVVRRVKLDNPGAKVLVLSGFGLERDRQSYLDMDVFAYLNKPVTAAVLGDAIRGAAAIHCATS